MQQSWPSRNALIEKLDGLISGDLGRADVADWAMGFVDDDCLRVSDPEVLRALKCMGAVDVPAPDRDYLYTVGDFEKWKADLLGGTSAA